MRNLKLQYCREIAATIAEVKFLLLDPNAVGQSDLIYAASSNKLYACRVGGATITTEELAEVPGIVGAEYLALDNEICLATDVGEVLLINPQTKAVTEGTFCDVGIECMAWSPDQEVVAFVTKTTRNVVVMTCTYDPIAEHALAEQCGGDGQFVNVGWGKKETQFHGTEGKSAAKQKANFQAPESIKDLPQDIQISWRADGSYFAVSFVSEEVGRMFKVFDKEGKLHFTSEKQNDLQPSIAWRPSGTWIAVPQRLPNKSTVALFEKNGLRHREIVLPFDLSEEPIASFNWSPDSEILAIETKKVSADEHNLYLYTIGNYHWYLKQVLSFKLSDPIAVYNWDNRIGEEKTLHVILKSGRYLIYRWHYSIDKFKRSGIVAVIDGNKLLLTDFSKTVVPPPMSNKELQIDSNINACALIANDRDELLLGVYDAHEQIHLYQSSTEAQLDFTKMATLQPFENIQTENTPLSIANMFWFNENYLVCGTCSSNATKVQLIAIDSDREKYKLQSSLLLSGIVNVLANGSAELEQIFAQTLDGKIQQISVKANHTLKLDKLYMQLDQPADHLQWFTTRDFYTSGLISLRTNQCLYVDTQRIAGDVTSFCLAGHYLAFTKLTGLFFMRLTDQRIVDERKIERGGKLITTINNDARTVLQMPRGNLEAICPRVLSLEIIAALLERKSYKAAMDMLRKQRINLNIICDHNMQCFVDNLDVFLEDISNPNWLNLFLSDLQNEDFSKTMYASNYKEGSQYYPEGFKIEQKVTYLCEKICERMEHSAQQNRFRLPIITAYVKIDKMEKALDIIWQEKKRESSTKADTKHAEEALKYLLYLVDVNQLYNVALGTYDFGLVLFVAQKSQKDPREFLPFLNELKTFEMNYRKFKIDEHLKRFEKALNNIALCGLEKFNESLEFIKRHLLFSEALKCYEKQEECYKNICLAFADHLRANGKLENASLMYERGGNYTQALFSAKHVLDWQRTLHLARKDNQNVESVALSLVPSLQENGKYDEAYQLLKTYGSSFTEALQCLLKGKFFLKALFEVRMKEATEAADEEDLIVSVITPDLIAYRSLLESQLLADQELFVTYKQRLLAIREKKAKQLQMGGDDDYEHNAEVDECDILSDTTSMHSSRFSGSSRGTGKTFRSSKNRRKHERKLLSLKPGNPFEDIALIDALHNHIMKIVHQQAHVRDTCKALIELQQQDCGAAVVQKLYKKLVTLVQESLDEIWIPEMMTAQQYLTGPNIDYTQLQNEQRYGMINPQKRFKPQLTIIDWEHEILR